MVGEKEMVVVIVSNLVMTYMLENTVHWLPIESNRPKSKYPPPIQNGDTEPNSKYCLKEYLNIV